MVYSTELYHHGVKGQRWGVRKAVHTTRKGVYGTVFYKKNGELNRLGLARKRNLTKQANSRFKKNTRKDYKTLEKFKNNNSNKAKMRIALAKNHISFNRKVLDFKREEIKSGLNFYERRRNARIGTAIGLGIGFDNPLLLGAGVAGATYYSRYVDKGEYAKRSAAKKKFEQNKRDIIKRYS